jgi:hypothetical protein
MWAYFGVGRLQADVLVGPAAGNSRLRENERDGAMGKTSMSGAQMVIKALVDQGVDVVFGYPGGAVLPIYDALFEQNSLPSMPRKAMPALPARWAWCW